MCWMCDHPKATRQDYLDHIRSVVANEGWVVQGVERGRVRPPYAYTVGLTPHGKPELVVTGMSLTRAAELLNDVAAHVLHAVAPEPGERIPLIGGLSWNSWKFVCRPLICWWQASYNGPQVRALQVVHADDRGRWPWEVGFRGVKGGQPVLGLRADIQPNSHPPAGSR